MTNIMWKTCKRVQTKWIKNIAILTLFSCRYPAGTLMNLWCYQTPHQTDLDRVKGQYYVLTTHIRLNQY